MSKNDLTKFTYENMLAFNILQLYFLIIDTNSSLENEDNDYYKINVELKIGYKSPIFGSHILSGGVSAPYTLGLKLAISCANGYGGREAMEIKTDCAGMLTFHEPYRNEILPYSKLASRFFDFYELLFKILYAEEKLEDGDLSTFHILFDRFYKSIQQIDVSKRVSDLDINQLLQKECVKDE